MNKVVLNKIMNILLTVMIMLLEIYEREQLYESLEQIAVNLDTFAKEYAGTAEKTIGGENL